MNSDCENLKIHLISSLLRCQFAVTLISKLFLGSAGESNNLIIFIITQLQHLDACLAFTDIK